MTTRTDGPSAAVRIRVMKRDRFRCTYCGAAGTDTELEVDHIIPVAKGGSHHVSNLTTACFSCNRGKGDKSVPDWPHYPNAPVLDIGPCQERSNPKLCAAPATWLILCDDGAFAVCERCAEYYLVGKRRIAGPMVDALALAQAYARRTAETEKKHPPFGSDEWQALVVRHHEDRCAEIQ